MVLPEPLDIDSLRRDVLDKHDASLRADVALATGGPAPALYLHEEARDATYTYLAALTRFRYALRDLR